MEFDGRITRVQPAKTGTRTDGSTWVELTFVFAYYEQGEQRYEDSVLVSTFDTNIIRSISQYLAKAKDAEGKEKVVYEYDCAKMLVPHIPCRCGFSLRAKTVQKKDKSGWLVIQENRCYKLEVISGQQRQQPAGYPAGTVAQQNTPQYSPVQQQGAAPFPPQVDANGNPTYDDLPF